MNSFFILITALSLFFVLSTMFITFVRWFSLIGAILSIAIYFTSPIEIRKSIDDYSNKILISITNGEYKHIVEKIKELNNLNIF